MTESCVLWWLWAINKQGKYKYCFNVQTFYSTHVFCEKQWYSEYEAIKGSPSEMPKGGETRHVYFLWSYKVSLLRNKLLIF